MKHCSIRHTLAIAAIGVGCFNQLDARAGVIHFWPCAASDSSVPAPNADFIAVSTGNYQTVGLKSNGTAVAWGFCGKQSCDLPAPNSGITAIACGDAFNLFLRTGGGIEVTGSNEFAQHDVPLPNSGFTAMAAGLIHAIALREDGSIAAWGYCGSHVPAPNNDWIAVAAGGYSSMGLKSDGTLWKWGCFFEPGAIIEPGTHFIAMACHYQHALANREGGSIFAWGSNDHGQLDVPAPNADFVKVACGADFSIGLKSNGSVVAWGNFGSNCNTPEPNTGYVAIAANNWHAYALKSRVVAGDINGDGAVNVADLLAVINAWGPCSQPCPPSCAADITGDCAVKVLDLLMVINNWG